MSFNLGEWGNWASIIGLPLAVVGLLLTYVIHRLTRSISSLAYQVEEWVVVGDDKAVFPTGVEIHYNGKLVPRVAKTTLVFWNSGTKTIRGDQIVVDNPLVLEVDEGDFLTVERIRASRFDDGTDVNRVEVVVVDGHHLIKFQYLDANDGATFQILHTGKPGAVKIKGTVQAIPKGVQRRIESPILTSDGRFFKWARPMFALGAIGLAILVINFARDFWKFSAEFEPGIFDWIAVIISVVVGSIVCLFLIVGYYLTGRKYPKALKPD